MVGEGLSVKLGISNVLSGTLLHIPDQLSLRFNL